MVSAVPIDRLLRESTPAAVILFAWALVAGVLPESVAGSARLAGVVMAALYVVVRGVHLAGSMEVAPLSTDPRELLAENLGVVVAAGAWLLTGAIVAEVGSVAEHNHLHVVAEGLLRPLSFALGTTGVATAVLYAVAAGIPRVREGPGGSERDGDQSADVTPSDD